MSSGSPLPRLTQRMFGSVCAKGGVGLKGRRAANLSAAEKGVKQIVQCSFATKATKVDGKNLPLGLPKRKWFEMSRLGKV